jgi:integrase
MPYKDRGMWRGVVTHNGQRFQKFLPTKREAAEWEREKRLELTQRTQSGKTFSLYYSEYLHWSKVRYSPNTYKEKETLGKRLLRFLGSDLPLEEITPKHIQDFILESSETCTNNRANRDRKNLHSFWHWTQKIHDLPANPVGKVDKLPHARKEQYVPPETHILKILSVADRKERLFLNCYLQTAARRSEIFRLRWDEDINFERREIRLSTQKTKDGSLQYEWLPLTDDLHEELLWWYRTRPIKNTPYVWVVEEGPYAGQPYTFRHKFLKGLCSRAGVRPFGFHSLRRYAASILADKYKVSSKTIQRILRHKNLSTTERYIKNLNTDLRATLNLLGSKDLRTKPVHNSASEADFQ